MTAEAINVSIVERPIYHIQHYTLTSKQNIVLLVKLLQEEEEDRKKILERSTL